MTSKVDGILTMLEELKEEIDKRFKKERQEVADSLQQEIGTLQEKFDKLKQETDNGFDEIAQTIAKIINYVKGDGSDSEDSSGSTSTHSSPDKS